jgi:transcriptional regulator with XRE-family HTH domain
MRYCEHCGNRLAQDNTESSCSACLRHTALRPPPLPPEFWDTDLMRDALATWHMGRVVYAYRTHPYHGRVLSQDMVASWLGLTQAQLSRIENGKAPDALSKLTHYAAVLGIPDGLLWFRVPEQQSSSARVSAPVGHGAAHELSVGKLQAASDRPPRVLEALTLAMSGHGTLDMLSDDLAELVSYYAYALSVTPSAAIYDELLSVRSAANSLLKQREGRAGQGTDLIVTAGWLSSLLAISASDMGEHAAALVWCADTDRRGREGGHPELQGWATLTRALIAYYQGQPPRSMAIAAQGQALTSAGSVVYAKLAAQEMRARALVGDAEGMAQAQRQARLALERLPPKTAMGGVFSMPLAADPPYTATSLLLMGREPA